MIKDLGRVVGKSAYEIACDNGFVGTEQEWLESLDGSNYDDTELRQLIETKVDKENGKVLSDNNFTDEEKSKLESLNNYDDSELQNQITQEIADRKSADTTIQNSISTTVNSAIAEIVANSPADFDTLKEIADWIDTHEDSASAMNTAIQENKNALNNKVDKVSGKGLSTNDYTTTEKNKLNNINIKNFGSPYNTTRYVEISSYENFAGVEVNIAYSGKWYFSNPGSAPLYLGSGGATYNNYGLTGYAWGTENKKLYLRFSGYRGVSVSVLGAMTNTVSISDWTTTAPTLPSGVSWKNDEYDIKANIDGKANITHTHGTNLSLGSYYYYSADVGTRFYWFKIIDGTVFNASNKHIRLQFNLASDNNFYYKSEYVLDVSYYATSATKNLSVALTNIYANSTKADSNIAIAVDENYNVYAQFNCIWESYVNITKLLGNIDFITTKGSYATFDTVAGFTSKAKITRNGCCKLIKNTSTNAISVSAIEDSYTYSTAVKAVNDKNGKDIATTYATTSSVSSSINTAMSGVINQVAASLNNYATKSELNNYVKQGGYKFDIYKYDSTLPTESGRLFIVEF